MARAQEGSLQAYRPALDCFGRNSENYGFRRYKRMGFVNPSVILLSVFLLAPERCFASAGHESMLKRGCEPYFEGVPRVKEAAEKFDAFHTATTNADRAATDFRITCNQYVATQARSQDTAMIQRIGSESSAAIQASEKQRSAMFEARSALLHVRDGFRVLQESRCSERAAELYSMVLQMMKASSAKSEEVRRCAQSVGSGGSR